MNDTPDLADIQQWLTANGHPVEWASFLHGLPQRIITPVCTIARVSKVHPALALGSAGVFTGDPEVKRLVAEHLARHDPAAPATPNRAARRAADRSQRRAR